MRIGYVNGGVARDPQGSETEWPVPDGIAGRQVFAPANASPWVDDPDELWRRADAREGRHDAQHARIMDVTLPRELPREAWPVVASMIFAPLAEKGMVWDVTIQCAPASDGGWNPHLHGTGTMRVLTDDGFGLKRRSWNTHFRSMTTLRRTIAKAINDVADQWGLGALVTPLANYERDEPPAEPRLPRWVWHDRGEGARQALRILDERREARSAFTRYKASGDELEQELEEARRELALIEKVGVEDTARAAALEPAMEPMGGAVSADASPIGMLQHDDDDGWDAQFHSAEDYWGVETDNERANVMPRGEPAGMPNQFLEANRQREDARSCGQPALASSSLTEVGEELLNGVNIARLLAPSMSIDDVGASERMGFRPSHASAPKSHQGDQNASLRPQDERAGRLETGRQASSADGVPADMAIPSDFAWDDFFNDLPGADDERFAADRDRERVRRREEGARLERAHRERMMEDWQPLLDRIQGRQWPGADEEEPTSAMCGPNVL